MTDTRTKSPAASHQPTKAEMEEVIVIDGAPDAIAAAVLVRRRAGRREPTQPKTNE